MFGMAFSIAVWNFSKCVSSKYIHFYYIILRKQLKNKTKYTEFYSNAPQKENVSQV